MSRRKIEAWAVVDEDGSFLAGPSNSRNAVEADYSDRWPSAPRRTTRLVPHSPTADAVVRAAVKCITRPDPYGTSIYKLRDAVERHERAWRRKK